MSVKIEINTDGYPMPENPTVDEVLSARIKEQEEILNALEVEKTKAYEIREMLLSITKEAARPRSTCL
jgi:uncharacterized iron-regulated protein